MNSSPLPDGSGELFILQKGDLGIFFCLMAVLLRSLVKYGFNMNK